MTFKKAFSAFVFVAVFVSSPGYAALQVSKLISNHMVLQRDTANAVWGWAEPGAQVKVCLPSECLSATANSEGEWRVILPATEASGPIDFHIRSGDEKISVSDVYFGDVWLAGGQSNMGWKLDSKIDNFQAELSDSNYPLIRFFEVPKRSSVYEENTLSKGHWLRTSPSTVENFSAIGWLFAKKNHLDKNVAVGIIESNWGGTPAQSWLSQEGLAKLPAYRERAQKSADLAKNWDKTYNDNEKAKTEKYRRLYSEEDTLATGAYRFAFDDSRWLRVSFPTTTVFDDLLWLRKSFELDRVPSDGVILDLGDLTQEAFIFVNEKLIATETWKSHGSRHTIAADMLKKGINLIALRIGSSWDNHPSLGTEENMYISAAGQRQNLLDNWVYSTEVEAPMPIEERFENLPAFLYNGMIHPLRHYGMRGVIWYQGESNVGEAPLYGDLFKGLINDWRRTTGQDFAFLFVQLAGFGAFKTPQANSAWAEIRFQQELALVLPNTGMATAVDVGEEFDVHPGNKQDVAKRLWLEARRVSFGDSIVSQAPRVVKHKRKGRKVALRFDTGSTLRVKDGAKLIQGFIVAGADGQFHVAKATLKGSKVLVWSDEVKKPVSLKYAWADFPKVNLYGENNLPVLPFKVDGL